MALMYKVEVGRKLVTTRVVNTTAQLDQRLGDLLSTIRDSFPVVNKRLVGLDIEKHYYQDYSKHQVAEKVAIVKLCCNDTCLIIQLLHMEELPCTLAEFFQLQDFSFAGVGMKHCLDALNRDYGFKCRNTVDLGQLVATVEKDEKFKAFGLWDLAYEVCDFERSRHNKGSAATLGSWGATKLSEQQIEAATWGAYGCYSVGNYLVGGFSLLY